MYCKYCGSEIDDDAEFCPDCGRPQHKRQKDIREPASHSRSRADSKRAPNDYGSDFEDSYDADASCRRPPQKKGYYCRKKKKSHILPIVLAVFLAAAVIIAVSLFGGSSRDKEIDAAISLVQNSYLGEYTDLTVKGIFDSNYLPRYKNSKWDGGYTDDDKLIVEVKYYDDEPDKNATTIQFTMLSEITFKVTAFVDPENEFKKPSDFLLALNCAYLFDYVGIHRDELRDLDTANQLYDRLGQIPSYAVQYGASEEFTASRTLISMADGESLLTIPVSELLDSYGLIYHDSIDSSEEAEWDESETIFADETENPSDSMAETTAETLSIPEESKKPRQPAETKPAAAKPAIDPDESAAAILEVLQGSRDLRLNVPESTVNIYSIYNLGDYFCDPPMYPEIYMLTDLDHDGCNEAIVRMNIAGEEYAYMILRYQDGTVYGFCYHFGKEQISSDGRVIRIAENGSIIAETFSFDHGNLYTDGYTVEDNEEFMQDWTDAPEHHFEFGDPMEGDSYESEPSQNMGIFRDNPAAADKLLEVLHGTSPLILSYSGETVNLYEITKVEDYADAYGPLTPIDFTVVDMDQDQTPEIITTVQGSQGNPWRLILRYQDGTVYGYGFPFRGLNGISMDGRVEGSSGAANTDFFRLAFNKTEIYSDPICGQTAEEIWASWVNVAWYEFNEQNISALVHK